MDEPSIIMICGMHRSGTSAVAGVLHRLGISVPGELMPPTSFNPKGYYENMDVFAIHEDFLRAIGSSWDDPVPLIENEGNQASAGDALKERLTNSLFAAFDGSTFIVKDPRISILMATWLDAAARARRRPLCIQVFRHPSAVSRSLTERDDIGLDHGLLLWLKHVLAAERSTRDQKRCFIYFEDMLEDWHEVVTSIMRHLGVSGLLDSEEARNDVNSFLDRELRHHTNGSQEASPNVLLVEICEQAFSALSRLSMSPYDPEAIASLDALSDRIGISLDLTGPFIRKLLARQTGLISAQKTGSATFQAKLAELEDLLASRNASIEHLEREVETIRAADERGKEATKLAAMTWKGALEARRSAERADASAVLLEQTKASLAIAQDTIAALRAQIQKMSMESSRSSGVRRDMSQVET